MILENHSTPATPQSHSTPDHDALESLQVAPGYEQWLCQNQLDSLDRIFADTLGQSLHKKGLDSWRQRRRIEVVLEGKSKTLFVKRFENPPRWAIRQARAAGIGARSVAGVEWGWMHRLHQAGISCPIPVALGEQFRNRREVRSVVIADSVPGQSLEQWALQWNVTKPHKPRILWATADLVRRFHALGVVHRDLYLSHIFFDPTRIDDSAFALIDLQRVFRPGWNRARWIVKDLAALHFSAAAPLVSRTERLRWLLKYLGKPRLDAQARRIVYRILGKSERMARRAARRQGASFAPLV